MVAALGAVQEAGYRGLPHQQHRQRRRRRPPATEAVAVIMACFDIVVESSKVGVRKPEPRFYEMACELLGVEPAECVFLDDLGINLKPPRRWA